MVPTREGAIAVGDGQHDLLEQRRDGYVGIRAAAAGWIQRPLVQGVINQPTDCENSYTDLVGIFLDPPPFF